MSIWTKNTTNLAENKEWQEQKEEVLETDYSPENLDTEGKMLLLDKENRSKADLTAELVFYIVAFIFVCVFTNPFITWSTKGFTSEAAVRMVSLVCSGIRFVIVLAAVLNIVDIGLYLISANIWKSIHLRSHLIKKEDREIINPFATEDIFIPTASASDESEADTLSRLEGTCEFCSGLYIHGKDQKCPHCHAPIPKIKAL